MKKLLRMKENGFTLAELIAVLAILAVVLSVAVGGIIAYTNHARYRKNNEYARTIFTAAQSSLSHMKASGTLEEFSNRIKKQEYLLPDEISGDHSGRLYAIMNQGEQKSLLDQLLGQYIYDREILDAAVCVELDPEDGVVSAVLYCDQVSSFTYTGTPGECIGDVMNIADRSESTRKKLFLGYYAAGLSDQAPDLNGRAAIGSAELENHEVLELVWSLSSKYKMMTGELVYTIQLMDETTGKEITFTINDNPFNYLTRGEKPSDTGQTLICQTTEGHTLYIYGYVTPDYQVHLVLDAVDLDVTPDQKIEKSTSGMRFNGFSQDSVIYARIQAGGKNFPASSWKQTASEPLLMGLGSKDQTFTIQNARHLYNLRYFEKEDAETPRDFLQTESFRWGGDDGILAHGNVYRGTAPVADTDTVFPSINRLQASDTFSASGSGLRIGNLLLRNGLFETNQGTAENLTFEECTVQGGEMTGTFCRLNDGGRLSGLSVKGGSVAGGKQTGAIVGASSAKPAVLAGLQNSAQVTGAEKVGGIIGFAQQSTTILDCRNTGMIAGTETSSQAIGGIAGECGGALKQCESAPGLSLDFAKLEKLLSQELTGYYVGGIVGRLTGSMEGCSTTGGYVLGNDHVGGIAGIVDWDGGGTLEANGSFNQADVIANHCAGGIVGENPERYTLKGWKNTGLVAVRGSQEDIFPNGCAGGITGWNSGTLQDCVSRPDEKAGDSQALVLLFDKVLTYSGLGTDGTGESGDGVGGLAGYNDGAIDLTENMDVYVLTAGGDYTGGLVGYNDGFISSRYQIAGGRIRGQNFVGGVAGVNHSPVLLQSQTDFSCTLEEVRGNSGVGGFTGANVLQLEGDLTASVGSGSFKCAVYAEHYFAGGLFGVNAAVNGQEVSWVSGLGKMLDSQVQLSELRAFTGSSPYRLTLRGNGQEQETGRIQVQAGTAAGGLIGFQANGYSIEVADYMNGASVEAVRPETDSGETVFYAGGITGWIPGTMTLNNCGNASGATVEHPDTEDSYFGALAEINEGTIQNCTAGSFGNESWSQTGGLVGLHRGGRIQNCTVNGTVTGRKAAGGVAAVNRGVIENCRAAGQVIGSGAGSFGAIAGINGDAAHPATIRDCTVHDGVKRELSLTGDGKDSNLYTVFSDQNGSGLGGIAGLNASQGQIINCRVQNAYIRGAHVSAGGVCGYNEGTIDECSIGEEAVKVYAQDGSAGGLIGENRTGGQVFNSSSSEGLIVASYENLNAQTALGGLIGLENSGLALSGLKSSARVSLISNHKNSSAGGLIGRIGSRGAVVQYCENWSTLSGRGGNAGGITGAAELASGTMTVFQECSNSGTIRMEILNGAGGILGSTEESGRGSLRVSLCENAQLIPDQEGCGGIVGRIGNADANVGLSRCVNYTALFSEGTGGMIGLCDAGAALQYCLQIPYMPNPMYSGYLNRYRSHNYYVEDQAVIPEAAVIKNILDWKTFEPVTELYDSDLTTDWVCGQGSFELFISLENHSNLESFRIYWGGEAGTEYTYTLYSMHSGIEKEIATFTDTAEDGRYHQHSFSAENAAEGMLLKVQSVRKNGQQLDSAALREIQLNTPVCPAEHESAWTQAEPLYLEKDGQYYKASNANVIIRNWPGNPIEEYGKIPQVQYYSKYSASVRAFLDQRDDLGTPDWADIHVEDGQYILEWGEVEGAYSYEISIYGKSQEGEEKLLKSMLIDNSCKTLLDPEDWQVSQIYFRVRAYNSANAVSSEKSSESVQVLSLLPAPQIRLELTDTAVYTCRLQNAEAYQNFAADQVIIQVEISGQRLEFSAAKGVGQWNAQSLPAGQTAVQIIVRALPQAGSALANTHMSSVRQVIRESLYPANGQAQLSVSGFQGLTAEELVCSVQVGMESAALVQMRTEAVVAGLYGDTVIAQADTASGTAELKGFSAMAPESSIQIRTYPWASSNSLIQYGHRVAQSVGGKDLEALKHTLYRNGVQIEETVLKKDQTGAYKRSPGYVLVQKENGNYDVYYSTFLYLKETSGSGAVTQQTVELPPGAQLPELEGNAQPKTAQDGAYSCTFTDPDPAPVYHGVFYGLEEDGSSVLLYEGEFTGTTVQLPSGDWAYTRIRLELTKPGRTDTNGFTQETEISIQQEYDLNVPLPSVQNLTARLEGSEDYSCRLTWEMSTEKASQSVAGYTVYLNGTAFVQTSGTDCSVLLDLSAYEAKAVQLAVQARVLPSAGYNQDGPVSPAIEIQLPSRLKALKTEGLSILPAYDPDQFISLEAFQTGGIRLNYADPAAPENVVVEWNAQICKNENGTGVLETLGTLRMNGSAKNAAYQWTGIPEDYGGYYLSVRIRAAADGQICSEWSEPKVFRLPGILMKPPELTAETVQIGNPYMQGDLPVSGTNAVTNQKALYWERDERLDSFSVRVTSRAGIVTELMVFQQNGLWKVSANGKEITAESQTQEGILSYRVPDYTQDVPSYQEGYTIRPASLYVQLVCQPDGQVKKIRIVLPDYSGYVLQPGGSAYPDASSPTQSVELSSSSSFGACKIEGVSKWQAN